LALEERNVSCIGLFSYGFGIAIFHILPVLLISYLKKPLTWGDTLDFLTPFVVIPLAYLLFYHTRRTLRSSNDLGRGQSLLAKIILGFGFLLYVEGHGLHLSSNSIARIVQNMKGSELFNATYLFDEIISHYMWDTGVFLISIGLIFIALRLPFYSLSKSNLFLVSIGAIFYGFNFTVNGIEGQTVVFTFPAAGVGFLLSFILYWKARREGFHNPFYVFFATAYFLSLVLFAYWGLSRSGFPQFSELGWI
jgi:hypothetical protein